jgi:DNA mismatch endonuclease (patch repair protein)
LPLKNLSAGRLSESYQAVLSIAQFMTDVHSKEIRSYNMSRIRSKNTKPELLVRKFLFSNGFRYRLHDIKLPGKPDLILPKYKTAIFVNGCFWHSHSDCRYATVPKTRAEWWSAKLLKNKIKDNDAVQKLKEAGWNVIVIWECELKRITVDRTLNQLLSLLGK